MKHTRRSFSTLALGTLLAPGALRAQTSSTPPTGVVELFTSQGCSSCPPADALFVELTGQPGVIPLTYNVEVWDYLGWRDTLARPAFTQRQRAYASMVAGKRLYTPQAIVNGRAHCVGSDAKSIARLRGQTAAPQASTLALKSAGGKWVATANLAAGITDAHMILLPISTRQTVAIGRGENSGRSVTYGNVVRDIIDLGPIAPGQHTIAIDSKLVTAADRADGFAVLLQAGVPQAPGTIYAGAIVDSADFRA